MPLLSDFLSGLAVGLRLRPRSCTRFGGHASLSRHLPLGQLVWRLCLVLLSLGLIGLALLAARGLPRAQSSAPVQGGAARAAPPASLDELLAIDPQASPRAWRFVVLHHSATSGGSAASFDSYHRQQRGWSGGLGYHFVIGNGIEQGDGEIVAGPRWYGQTAGAHANSPEHNEFGIGICLVGNFDEQVPTPAQLAALKALLSRLRGQFALSAEHILGHNQIRRGGATACPGKHFPWDELKAAIFEKSAGSAAAIR